MSDSSKSLSSTSPHKWEQRLENLLWRSRFLVLLAVIPSLVAAVVLFIIGTMDIVQVLWQTLGHYILGSDIDIHDSVVTDIIIAIDIYLIAIVLMIFGLGVYRLFVSQIEASESEGPSHPFNVKSFDQLKDKIVRVVILAVIIEFFRAVVDIHFKTPLDGIYLALSALALAAALYLMSLAYKANAGKD